MEERIRAQSFPRSHPSRSPRGNLLPPPSYKSGTMTAHRPETETDEGHPSPAGGAPSVQETGTHVDAAERRHRERRVWRLALLISAGLHVLVFLLWPGTRIPVDLDSAAGPRSYSEEAAEGMMQAVALQSAPPDAVQPPAVPTPDLELPTPMEVEPDAAPEVDLSAPDLPDPGQGASRGSDPDDTGPTGLPERTGAGDAGAAEEGRFRMVPPSPRGVIFPPTNRDLRGTEIEIRVFVTEAGQVVPDSTRLEPPTSDRSYNERLKRDAAEWVFEPAREGGQPVAAWFRYTVTL